MAKKQIAKRIISCISKINGQKIKEPKLLTESCWIDISKAIGSMSDWPILINDEISKSEDIFDYCLRLKEKNKLEVLFVDYLGLLTSHKKIDSKRLEIEYISRLLKEIALDLHIPVVCLCQLSRSNDKDNREPKMSDLRESGSIEQDADNVILLHNATENQEQETTEMKIKVIVAKQRNGATGYFKLKYYPNVFKFYDYF
jgi:replicative DNA helicase